MFSYISLEERVPQTHPLRKLRAAVVALLATMNREFDAVYARRGRPSVPPEMLLKALLLQILFSIRSNAFVEAMNGLLQQAKRAARGFRTSQNFIAIAYLRMSKLRHLPASPFAPAMPQ